MAKDIGYFTHDHDARTDPKTKALIRKYGMEGYGRFWVIIEIMRATNGHKISEKKYELEALAEEMKCSVEDLRQFLKDCVDEFELFIKEDGFYYSESLLGRLAKLESLRAARQRGAYAMHEKYHHNITQDPNEPPD